MKTKTKMIVLAVAMFVIGIVATCMFIRIFMLPDLAKDIGKFGLESSREAYVYGFFDGAQKSDDCYNAFLDGEQFEEIDNWEYKYIK